MKKIFAKIAATVATGAAVMSAYAFESPKANAASLTIVNAGFETPVLQEGGFTFEGSPYTGAVPGWQVYDPDGIIASFTNPTGDFAGVGLYNPLVTTSPGAAPEGNNIAYIYLPTYAPDLVQIGSGVAGLSQILSSTLAANTLYTLKVDIGNIDFDTSPVDYSGFPGYEVQLVAGGNVLATENALNPADGTFATSVLSFLAPANSSNLGDALEIRLINRNAAPGTEVLFDNVRLDATSVPEPASVLGLLAFGAIGATLTRKKKPAAD